MAAQWVLTKPRHDPVSADGCHLYLRLFSGATGLWLPSSCALQISQWWDPAGNPQAKQSRKRSFQTSCPSWEGYVSISSMWRPGGCKLALLISLESAAKAQARDKASGQAREQWVCRTHSTILPGVRTGPTSGGSFLLAGLWARRAQRWMERTNVESGTLALSPFHHSLPRCRSFPGLS